VTLSQVVLAPM